jgi:hypothetical protein
MGVYVPVTGQKKDQLCGLCILLVVLLLSIMNNGQLSAVTKNHIFTIN